MTCRDRARSPHKRTVDAGFLSTAQPQQGKLTRKKVQFRPGQFQRQIDKLVDQTVHLSLSKSWSTPPRIKRAFYS